MRCSVALIAETSQVDGSEQEVAALQEHFAAVMDALVEQEEADGRLSNADLSVALAEHRATFSFDVEEDSIDGAVELARAVMRAAIHDAGGFTPGWEKHRWSVLLDEADDDLLVDA